MFAMMLAFPWSSCAVVFPEERGFEQTWTPWADVPGDLANNPAFAGTKGVASQMEWEGFRLGQLVARFWSPPTSLNNSGEPW
jgi:hypothetical protein